FCCFWGCSPVAASSARTFEPTRKRWCGLAVFRRAATRTLTEQGITAKDRHATQQDQRAVDEDLIPISGMQIDITLGPLLPRSVKDDQGWPWWRRCTAS